MRCVVSVGMLTEGWDAQNVTQILGLRAFQSQLLCEQVMGRGLRRINYNFELDEDGVPQHEEYVDVYGIPFEVIPVKKKATTGPTPPVDTTLVQALREREKLFRMEFPRVEGYVFEVRQRIKADLSKVAPVTIEPSKDPTETVVRAIVGYQTGEPTLAGPGKSVEQTRREFYESARVQQLEYELARRVTRAPLGEAVLGEVSRKDPLKFQSRQLLFPQVLQLVREFLTKRVDYADEDHREVGLERYMTQITERLCSVIEPDEAQGETPLKPRLERFRPKGSTSEVLFRTVRPCSTTRKSHISHVVLDTATWERSVAYALETSDAVDYYARNDHLDFLIPYDFEGASHDFNPDFLVRLTNGTTLVLEVKGYEDEVDRAKYEAARKWVRAVNNWGEMGVWRFEVCKDTKKLKGALARWVAEA